MLLVAVHEHELGVVTEIDADPPAAGNAVVVVPVMIWQPDGPVELSLQLAAANKKAIAEKVTSARRETWRMSMRALVAQITPFTVCVVQLRADVQAAFFMTTRTLAPTRGRITVARRD